MHLPQKFIEKVNIMFGEKGRQWLSDLSVIITRCKEKWGIGEGIICPNMNFNYIEFTTLASGESVALKIGVPHKELFSEMEALELYAGRGAVSLIETDRDLGAILMQQIQPGTMLWELGDNRKETEIAVKVMQELPVAVPPSHRLPRFSQWVERAFLLTRTKWDPCNLMPRDLIDSAENAFKNIQQSGVDHVVLHGDLHHENILFDDLSGRWVAIDPKGVIGPHCLEVGRYMLNQLPGSLPFEHREKIVLERIKIFSSQLGYSQETIAASSLVDGILSRCWSLEDGVIDARWYDGITLARMLSDLVGL